MKRHLVIPDCQVKPGIKLDYLRWLGLYIADKRPDVIVQIGDFADMPSLSSYDKGKKSFEGRRYKKDIKAVRDGMEALVNPFRKVYQPKLYLTLGNHEDRITRAIEDDPKLDGTIGLGDLGYEAYGWKVYPYLKPVTIDGITYAHFFPSGQMGRPCTSAAAIIRKYHASCFAGHQQGRDIAYSKGPNGKSITAIIAGSYYSYDQSYLNAFTNAHWRGVYVLHEVRNGQFDEMAVSLNYLKRKYEDR